jgi:integrase
VLQPVTMRGEPGGVSAATGRRRLSILSGFFAFLQARGDVVANPVPRGLPNRRERSRPGQGVPLVRAVRRLPRILAPAEVDALMAALRTHRDRAMVAAMVLGGLRLRVSEYTSLRADAVVQIGAGTWLHVPVGKLREDRYLPLHPHLAALIDNYRSAHVGSSHPLLLPRENGRALDRHTVTRMINKAGAAAGLPHIHPHQLWHTLATQAKKARSCIGCNIPCPGVRQAP